MHPLQHWFDAVAGAWYFAPLLIAVVWFDALIPLLPAELLVISSGSLAASTGHPPVWLVFLAATVGATLGDHTAYAIGRWGGPRVIARLERRPKIAQGVEWSRREIDRHGWVVILLARHVPVGRTASNLVLGSLHYPFARFTPVDLLACVLWASYTTFAGYFGGQALHRFPLPWLVTALFFVAAVVAVLVVVRQRRRHSTTSADPT